MNRNTNLLLAIADHIEKHPEQHDQHVWAATGTETACGTAACIAGWAVLKAKPHWLTPPPEDPEEWWEFGLLRLAIQAEVPDLPPRWEEVGQHLLGLEYEEARRLFDGSAHLRNDNHTWPDVLREIANGGNVMELVE